jgi:hypothetical protein
MSLPAAAVLPSCLRLPGSRLLLRSLRLLLLAGLLHRLLPLRLLASLLDRLVLRLLLPGLLGRLLPLRLLLMSLLGRLVLRLLCGLVLRLLLPGLLGRLLTLRLLLTSLLGRLLPLRHLLMSLLDLLRFRRLSALRLLLGWRPLLWLLCTRLRPLWLCLRARLLLWACGRRGCACRCGLLGPALLLFRLALFLLLVLCVRRDNHPEKQKHGHGTGGSNELHHNHPQISSLSVVHLEHQSASGTPGSTVSYSPATWATCFFSDSTGTPWRSTITGALSVGLSVVP